MTKQLTSAYLYTFCCSLAVISHAQNDEQTNWATKLKELGDDFWDWRAEIRPGMSMAVGEYRFNDRVKNDSYHILDELNTTVSGFLDRLQTISREQLQREDQITYDVLHDMLTLYINGNQWKDFGPLNRFNFLEGLQKNPAAILSGTPLDTWGDIINYLSRLQQIPGQVDQHLDNARMAISKNGYILHNVSVNRIPKQIDNMLATNRTQSAFYIPFLEKMDGINTISDQIKALIKMRAEGAVRAIFNKFTEVKAFISNEYMPNSRVGYGVSTVGEEGRDFYRAALKWHASYDVTPEEIHQKGLSEVERIANTMLNIITKLSNHTTIRSFFEATESDDRFYRKTSEELIALYTDLIRNAEERIPELFENYPGLPVIVKPMPNDGPQGIYSRGSEDGRRPGIFWANTIRPSDTVTFGMPALVLHETVPGHHLQIGNYEITLDLPKFRKYRGYSLSTVPTAFPRYTAYSEGWALYAESLGEEMGSYRDDYELLGRYSSEMFRACRLVVDTGLHYYSWDRERAIEFVLNNTGLTRNTIETEIDRYITWPGQACSYKIGELKIQELRTLAQKELGDDFDIRKFHSVVLREAAVPMSVLDDSVRSWITEVKVNAQKPPNSSATARMSMGTLLSVILLIFM